MGGVDFGGSQSHSMYLRFGGGYAGPGTKVEAYDSQRDRGDCWKTPENHCKCAKLGVALSVLKGLNCFPEAVKIMPTLRHWVSGILTWPHSTLHPVPQLEFLYF
ncbi:Uncharacterized protein HZ326_31831 [Fusarium oxysporum f. sp. albedinis]|nr:Uncharacterized protein HZ326_31831 [Fusarium oxysporum f. sp. albedinis]